MPQATTQAYLDEFNRLYPRPGMPPFRASAPFNLLTDWRRGSEYPNSNHPGVYLFFAESQSMPLYIGSASCEPLGQRIGNEYFGYSADRSHGVARDSAILRNPRFAEVRFIVTVGISDHSRAFEAPALEQYLIGRLDPPMNTHARIR